MGDINGLMNSYLGTPAVFLIRYSREQIYHYFDSTCIQYFLLTVAYVKDFQ
jgi:hypothetical protein